MKPSENIELLKRISLNYHQRGIELTQLQIHNKAMRLAKNDCLTYEEALEEITADSVGRYRKED